MENSNINFSGNFSAIMNEVAYEDYRARKVGVRELGSLLEVLQNYEGVEEMVEGINNGIRVLSGNGCIVHQESADYIKDVMSILGDNRELGGEKVKCSDGRVRTFHAVLYWFADVHNRVFGVCEQLIKKAHANNAHSFKVNEVDEVEDELLEDAI
jgi:hypothetical protein